MTYESLLEFLAAVHLSQRVASPFMSRGGCFLVAPPGALKTTINDVMNEFPRTFVLSDINVKQISRMREYFLSGEIETLGFSDYAKLYKRNPNVAQNLEGIILGLVEEGFRRPAFQPQIPSTIPAYCTIVGAMTPVFYESKIEEWSTNGFERRFLWLRYVAKGLDVLERAVRQGRHAQLANGFNPKIPNQPIPETITKRDDELIDRMTRHIHYRINAIKTLRKVLCVLRWKFGSERAHWILRDIAPCMGKDGGILMLAEVEEKRKRRKQR